MSLASNSSTFHNINITEQIILKISVVEPKNLFWLWLLYLESFGSSSEARL
jgi:hypothetical protein